MTPTEFTPFVSLGGGLLIGLSAVMLMAILGRIMGATGVLTGLIMPTNTSDMGWRAALVAGMVTAPTLYLLATGDWPEISVPVSNGALILGGLIVGIGVTFSGGCTSGHGVCGIARLSRRSIVATGVFMAAAIATVFVTRHLIGGF